MKQMHFELPVHGCVLPASVFRLRVVDGKLAVLLKNEHPYGLFITEIAVVELGPNDAPYAAAAASQ